MPPWPLAAVLKVCCQIAVVYAEGGQGGHAPPPNGSAKNGGGKKIRSEASAQITVEMPISLQFRGLHKGHPQFFSGSYSLTIFSDSPVPITLFVIRALNNTGWLHCCLLWTHKLLIYNLKFHDESLEIVVTSLSLWGFNSN